MRCTLETSEDELIIDRTVPLIARAQAHFFKLLLSLSVPRYRYFGLVGEATAGLSKIVIPIHVTAQGARVEIPEFSFAAEATDIDPDTHAPSTVPFVPV
jgi:hypothetical protein